MSTKETDSHVFTDGLEVSRPGITIVLSLHCETSIMHTEIPYETIVADFTRNAGVYINKAVSALTATTPEGSDDTLQEGSALPMTIKVPVSSFPSYCDEWTASLRADVSRFVYAKAEHGGEDTLSDQLGALYLILNELLLDTVRDNTPFGGVIMTLKA